LLDAGKDSGAKEALLHGCCSDSCLFIFMNKLFI
jgi:hypothetical protein